MHKECLYKDRRFGIYLYCLRKLCSAKFRFKYLYLSEYCIKFNSLIKVHKYE